MGPERIAGRYRVERAVGRGGMGTVWLCVDELLGRQVAVKQIGTMPGEEALDVPRAMREARALAALNHRNVVSVYDAVEEGDHIWLVMEYVPGRSLSEILAHEGPLTPERAAWIGAQVADGLAAAHDRGTIHRDVKPGNILVTDDWVAKISDFGIARTSGDPQLTRSGMVTGTPTYFAPELARGEAPTSAADVWALGATLYLAVEGHPLFPEQANPLAVIADIASRQPPEPQQAGFLSEPINRALDPDPGSRWSMPDLAHVLHRLSEHHATGHTRAVTADLPPVAAAAAEPPPDPAPDSVPEPVPEPAGAPPPRRKPGGRLIAVGLAALLLLAVVAGVLLLRDVTDDASNNEVAAPEATGSPEGDETGQESTPAEPSPEPSDEPSDEASNETSNEASDETSSPSSDTSVDGSDAEEFVTSYYDALPADPKAGWSSLSGQLRSEIGGYGSYRGFWDTIDAVTVTSTEPVGDGAVEVSLTYTRDDGSTAKEARRLEVESAGDGYVIVGDQVVG